MPKMVRGNRTLPPTRARVRGTSSAILTGRVVLLLPMVYNKKRMPDINGYLITRVCLGRKTMQRADATDVTFSCVPTDAHLSESNAASSSSMTRSRDRTLPAMVLSAVGSTRADTVRSLRLLSWVSCGGNCSAAGHHQLNDKQP